MSRSAEKFVVTDRYGNFDEGFDTLAEAEKYSTGEAEKGRCSCIYKRILDVSPRTVEVDFKEV